MLKIALIGASSREDSLALKLQNRILSRKQILYPITPKYPEIQGIKTYSSLAELPETPDLLVFMVNPSISLQTLATLGDKKIKKVWFQPGSYDDQVIQKAQELGLTINTQHCMLVSPLQVVQNFVHQQ